jgi:hypothetical protein
MLRRATEMYSRCAYRQNRSDFIGTLSNIEGTLPESLPGEFPVYPRYNAGFIANSRTHFTPQDCAEKSAKADCAV